MGDINDIVRRRKIKLLLQSLQDCRYKLASVLGVCAEGDTDSTKRRCDELYNMSASGRRNHVAQYWSIDHLQNADVMLMQLKSIEEKLNQLEH
jgi:hypothetical protein